MTAVPGEKLTQIRERLDAAISPLIVNPAAIGWHPVYRFVGEHTEETT